ncbi:MAG: YqeG family HAD IIIA-type phosphatase [Clostridiaceae bacterium]|nr:YqeG family HAD IIIA-type phosphatase [Clostridiaceae bacterium]
MLEILKPDTMVKSIYSISPEGLIKNKIFGLILDIDNTLVATHIKKPDDNLITYLKALKESGIKTIIVSNAKKERVEEFCKPLEIDYVYKALKPLGRGFNLAVEKLGLPRKNIAIIGDQLFTDILGGNLNKIHTILIKPIDLNEQFPIKLKRIFEKPFLYNKQYDNKL